MVITNLVYKNSRVQVFTDGIYSFSCSINFLYDNKIKINNEIDNYSLTELKKSAPKDILSFKLGEYVILTQKSATELFNKLNVYSLKKFGLKIQEDEFESILEKYRTNKTFNEKKSY
jgi:hypothetical protein